MDLRQMFPKENLDGQDLYEFCKLHHGGQPITVTIERIDYKTSESDTIGSAEITYFMFVKEFKKPFKLSAGRAKIIANVLGTTETDDWDGRTVKVKGDTVEFKGTTHWVVQPVIDPPDAVSRLPRKQDITGLAFAPKPNNRSLTANANPATESVPLGTERAAKMVDLLTQKNRTVKDAIAHIATVAPQLLPLVSNCIPPKWPSTAAPWVGQFCKSLPNGHPAMSEAGMTALLAEWSAAEKADVVTGEVIGEDDIPF